MSVIGTIGTTIGRGWAPAAPGGDVVIDGTFAGDGTAMDTYVEPSLIAEGNSIEDNFIATASSASSAGIFTRLDDIWTGMDLSRDIFATPFATFSSAIEGGIKWLAGASGTGGADAGDGGVNDPSGVGNGGSNGGGGVNRHRPRPIVEKKITWAELAEKGRWQALLDNGRTKVSFMFDRSSEASSYKDAMQKTFGGLVGVATIVCQRLLIPAEKIPFGPGVRYEMMLAKYSDRVVMTELTVFVDGEEELNVIHPNSSARVAYVKSGGDVTQYRLGLDGRPRKVVPGVKTPERPPEGSEIVPTEQEVEQAIVDLWTLDFTRVDFAHTMKKTLIFLQGCPSVIFDQYFTDLLKACDAYLTAQAVDSLKGEASDGPKKALSVLREKYVVWSGSENWYERVVKAVAILAVAQSASAEAGYEADVSSVVSTYVPGTREVVDWLIGHGYGRPTLKSEFNGRLMHYAKNPWDPNDVKALFEALDTNGEGGREYIRAMTGDFAVLLHDFATNNVKRPIRIYVRPADILPFIENGNNVDHRRSFTRREIGRLVELVALLRLGAGLHARKLITDTPAGEDSISKTIGMIARSIAGSGEIPVLIPPSLKRITADVTVRSRSWCDRLRLFMAQSGKEDYLIMEPIMSNTDFGWDGVINDMISETGYAGRIWIVKPSGELARDFDPAERQDVAAAAEPASKDDMIRRLGSVVTIGGMVEWVEEFLGAEVSQGSVFYSISPNRIVPLVTHLASMGGEVGREFFARLANGAEALARYVETEAGGFGVEVKVAPEALLKFLNDSKDRDGAPSSFSVDVYTGIIDLLASLRAEWFSFIVEGRSIKGKVDEDLLKATEQKVAIRTGKYGVVPKAVTFRLDEGAWSPDRITDLLKVELAAAPNRPFVFILGPSPKETEVPASFLKNALKIMVAKTGFKSWFVLANVDGKTLYDSLE